LWAWARRGADARTLQERAVFIRERANGLYSPGQYLLASTLVSVPFLFVCTLVYSLIMCVLVAPLLLVSTFPH